LFRYFKIVHAFEFVCFVPSIYSLSNYIIIPYNACSDLPDEMAKAPALKAALMKMNSIIIVVDILNRSNDDLMGCLFLFSF
jgi:hypothetical protein